MGGVASTVAAVLAGGTTGAHVTDIRWSTTQHDDHPHECGHCGHRVGATVLAHAEDWDSRREVAMATACSVCKFPSAHVFDGLSYSFRAYPPAPVGRDVEHLPVKVERAYRSARTAIMVGSYDGAALVLRNLLAHMAVELGADEGLTYKQYVDWLADNGHAPPGSADVVTSLKDLGNETAHELIDVELDDVLDALQVAETLLRFRFEAPESVRRRKTARKR